MAGLDSPHMGVLFGKRVVVERGERWEGAVTKTSRQGQKYDTDGLGSDVCVVCQLS